MQTIMMCSIGKLELALGQIETRVAQISESQVFETERLMNGEFAAIAVMALAIGQLLVSLLLVRLLQAAAKQV